MIPTPIAWFLLAVVSFSLGFAIWMNIYHPINRPEEVKPMRNISTVIILGLAFLVFWPSMRIVDAYGRLRRRLERRGLWQEPMPMPELPPAPEAPTVPNPAREQLARVEKLRVAYVARRMTKQEREDVEAVSALIQEVSRG